MVSSRPKFRIALLAVAGCGLLIACVGRMTASQNTPLSENELFDLIDHPKKWDGETVVVKIYPYDNGFTRSYIVCFEQCGDDYASTSPFIVYTVDDRFKGSKGNQPAIIKARYSSICAYKYHFLCPDQRFGRFFEIGVDTGKVFEK